MSDMNFFIIIISFVCTISFLLVSTKSLNPVIWLPLIIIFFLVGWFIVFGISGFEDNDEFNLSQKENVKKLKAILAFLAIVFIGFNFYICPCGLKILAIK